MSSGRRDGRFLSERRCKLSCRLMLKMQDGLFVGCGYLEVSLSVFISGSGWLSSTKYYVEKELRYQKSYGMLCVECHRSKNSLRVGVLIESSSCSPVFLFVKGISSCHRQQTQTTSCYSIVQLQPK